MTPFYEDTVRVEVGEAFVIAPIDTLEHVASVYRTLAEEQDDPKPWNAVAQMFEEWIAEKGFFPEDLEEDEELYEKERETSEQD